RSAEIAVSLCWLAPEYTLLRTPTRARQPGNPAVSGARIRVQEGCYRPNASFVTHKGESLRGKSHDRQTSGPPLSRCSRRTARTAPESQPSWIDCVFRSPRTVLPSKSAQQRETRPSQSTVKVSQGR